MVTRRIVGHKKYLLLPRTDKGSNNSIEAIVIPANFPSQVDLNWAISSTQNYQLSLDQDEKEIEEPWAKHLEEDDDNSDISDPMYSNNDPKAGTISTKNLGEERKEKRGTNSLLTL